MGCGEIAVPKESHCEEHLITIRRQRRSDDQRPSARQRGYTRDWEKARTAWLIDHPFCVDCERETGRLVAGNVVDHKQPHRGNKDLFWDKRNWQTLCTPHHNRKTARDDGGFGNERRHT